MPQEHDDAALLVFAEVMRRLRAECPWKREQTHRSLSRYLLEETYETLDAIDAGDRSGDWTHLREELGDLLLQVYFHAVVAEESGAFTLGDVAADITAKMRRRNPHVFGEGAGTGAEELDAVAVNEVWQQVKAGERATTRTGDDEDPVLDGLPPALPALLRADKVLERLERAGRHTPRRSSPPARMTSAPVGSTVTGAAEGAEGAAERIGADLLALVERARADGVDPEQALRDAVRRLVEDA